MDTKSTIILFICGMIIIYIVTDLIMAHLSYKPLFDWWDGNDGSRYSNLFSLSTCMMSYYSTPLYYFSKLTISPQEFLDLDQIAVLVGDIFPYLRATVGGVQTGILLPRHLCESVLLKISDGDTLFNNWYQSTGTNRDENSYLVYGTATPGQTGADSQGNTYTYLEFGSPQADKSTGLIGVYPAPSDSNSWMGLISEWGGPNLKWQADKSNTFYSPEPLQTPSDGSGLSWFNYNNTGAPRPDNFLARMGIPPDSPLVVYFCTGKYSVNGLPVDASALSNLFHQAGANAGGWIGYIRGRGPLASIDELRNYIYTKVDWLAAPNKPCNPSGSALNTASSIASTAIPGLLMCLPMMFNPAGAFSMGIPAVLGLIGVGAQTAIAGVKAAGASTC
jgi:hypothetical protein